MEKLFVVLEVHLIQLTLLYLSKQILGKKKPNCFTKQLF